MNEQLKGDVMNTEKIWTHVTTVKVPAVQGFIAAEKFREGKGVDGVEIALLGINFKTNFFGKPEESVEATEIEIKRLDYDPPFVLSPVIIILGNAGKTTLPHFWELLKKQGCGHRATYLPAEVATFLPFVMRMENAGTSLRAIMSCAMVGRLRPARLRV